MDHEKMMNELDRLLDSLHDMNPCEESYATVLKRYKELYQIFLEEDSNCEAQMEKRHKYELELKKLEIEGRKLDIQEKEADAKIEVEQIKAQNYADESRASARYTKSQARWRLVEIGAQGLVMIACICITGKFEESTILNQKMWSLLPKPKF